MMKTEQSKAIDILLRKTIAFMGSTFDELAIKKAQKTFTLSDLMRNSVNREIVKAKFYNDIDLPVVASYNLSLILKHICDNLETDPDKVNVENIVNIYSTYNENKKILSKYKSEYTYTLKMLSKSEPKYFKEKDDADFFAELVKAMEIAHIDDVMKPVRYGDIDFTLPHPNVKFSMKDRVVVTADLNYALHGISQYDQNKLTAQWLFKLEPRIELSYFILVFSYNKSLLLITDITEFDNPNTARSTRNPSRHREDVWGELPLPYSIATTINKETEKALYDPKKPFIYTVDINDIDRDCTTFIYFFTLFYKDRLPYINIPQKRMITAKEFISSSKLLASGKFEAKDSEFEDINSKSMQQYFDFITENVRTKSTALVTTDIKSLISNKLYEPNALLTPDQHIQTLTMIAYAKKS